ncbi:hypothetical protein GCM10018793_45250 [Streptomyces sulfonofaciens]|uniref:Antitoxin n=1 Tax=Streptomyces sulfonofaciens TaxID=68272 RepID=A0A919GFM6_9ACTN|nr:antitoxin [Streptomyces sulfonofaciens]GHH83358.1 hypothetical protein GCM10018793_45250 [Streptomyces sulfonofaciens]
MSVMDRIKSMLKGHPEQSEKAVDKGGDFADDKTQGRYRSQTDTAQEKAKEQFGRGRDDNPPRQ